MVPTSLLVLLFGLGLVGNVGGYSLAEHEADDPVVQKRISLIFWVSRIELVLLFLGIIDMVVKPGL